MKKKKSIWRRIANTLLLLMFLAGAGILSYPTISDMWNSYRNAQLISKYEQAVQELGTDRYEALWKQAREYNAQHTVNTIVDAFGEGKEDEMSHPYDEVLDPNGDGLMGSIYIPKLNQKIAIYHGLGKDALERGAGHVEGTSLPIGGESTHAALAAHRGLPSAKLFTDLDQIKEGDIFVLSILDEKLAYKVDQIKTVLPEETEDLAIVEGEDYVTLITCTPYGVNSHRLLVRGSRTEYVEEEIPQEKITVPEMAASMDPKVLLAAGAVVVLVVILILYFVTKRKKGGR